MEIELRNIKYENNNEILLNNINIKFDEGKITSIIGSSGSGKTLIGNIIVNLISPTEGYMMIDGKRNYDIDKSHKDIGYTFQNSEEYFFNKTVYEELEYNLKRFKYKEKRKEERIEQSLKIVGLNKEILTKNPQNLSDGERKLLILACALILNPKVLVLDEPTTYLDSKNKKQIIKIIKKLKKDYKKTIIILSNDIEFVRKVSDKIILIKEGRIILDINTKELYQNYDILKENNMEIPPIINFLNILKKEKNIEISPIEDINDLIKEVYKNVK